MRKHMPAAIVLGCLLIQFFNIGVASNCFSLYLPYMRSELLFTDSQTSIIVAARMLFSLLGLFCMRAIYRRLGARLSMALSSVLFSAGLFSLSFSKTFFACLLSMFPYGFGYALANLYGATILLDAWFKKSYGLALGLVSSGSGLAAFFATTPISLLLQNRGLLSTYFWVGTASLISGFVSFILLRDDPHAMGLSGYGDTAEQVAAIEQTEHERYPGPSPRLFLMLTVVFLLSTLSLTGVSHFSVFFIERGYTPEQAAYAVTGFGLSLIFVKPFYGWLVDRYGAFYINIVYYALGIVGLVLSLTVCRGSVAVLIVSTALIGIGSALCSNGLPTWAKDLYPENHYDINQKFAIVCMISGVVFTSVPGILKDRLGSYWISFLGITLANVVGLLLLIYCYRVKMGRVGRGKRGA